MSEYEAILEHLERVRECLMGLYESGLSTVYDVSMKELKGLAEMSGKLGMKFLAGELSELFRSIEREKTSFTDERNEVITAYRRCFMLVGVGIDQVQKDIVARNYA